MVREENKQMRVLWVSLFAFLFSLSITGPFTGPLAWSNENDHDKVFDADIRFRYFYDIERDSESVSNEVSQEQGTIDPRIWDFVPENEWEQRMIVTYKLRAGEPFKGRFGLLYDGRGILADNRMWSTRETTESPRSIDLTDHGLLVAEAFGHWVPNDRFEIQFGRSYWTLANGSVLSPNFYQQVPIATDGIALYYNTEFFNSQILFAEVSNTDTGSLSTLRDIYDRKFWGLNLEAKSLDSIERLSFHVIQVIGEPSWQRSRLSSPWVNENFEASELRYGVILGGNLSNLDYNFAFAAHEGSSSSNKKQKNKDSVDTKGDMFDIRLGYSFPELGDLRFYGGFHRDSGDDGNDSNGQERYDPFYYNFHDNAGSMDVLQWGNLTYYHVGMSLEPTEKFILGASYFMFSATEKNDNFHSLDRFQSAFSADNLGASNGLSRYWKKASDADASSRLGTEVDVWISKQHGNHLNMSLIYGLFTPGDYFAKPDNSQYEAYSRLLFQTSLTF